MDNGGFHLSRCGFFDIVEWTQEMKELQETINQSQEKINEFTDKRNRAHALLLILYHQQYASRAKAGTASFGAKEEAVGEEPTPQPGGL